MLISYNINDEIFSILVLCVTTFSKFVPFSTLCIKFAKKIMHINYQSQEQISRMLKFVVCIAGPDKDIKPVIEINEHSRGI